MGNVRAALKMQRDAQRRRALAPDYDPVRRNFDTGLADEMERDAQALLIPEQPLQAGLGGEIIPPAERGLSGLESVLKEPDLLNLGASEQRAQLLEQTGVLELGIETAQDARADGSVQKMITHQMAALHSRAMTMLAESETAKIPEISIMKARAAARMVDAFSRCALTLQRLQTGGGQTIQVQYMQVNAMVGAGSENMQNPSSHLPVNKGGRPPTTGYRTKKSVEHRINDRELLSSVKRMEELG
jgi:hypothetical protein